ncbi:BAI1-associated protein 3 isoform X2 [Nilaparvata lugens]|uniref:BAI1-associated protein 3 isoform X2 n=1 Tax=Nilaparvata lugens TaxID=108931 RepID=UPI00193D600C|nr:BAI1-associated protein 3 isoform X2 [Nilaparvata lugens]XP_039285686.1 BAI1-associated protein 3 isoform X2 [Nilaparvata lugens]
MSFFNSLQQYVTSSVANLSLSPKRFSLSKESGAAASAEAKEVAEENGGGAVGAAPVTGGRSASVPGFPKVVPAPGTLTPPRRRTLEGPRRVGSFRQPSHHPRQPLAFCRRRLSWPEVDQQATSGVQETDGSFFESFTALSWKLENRRLLTMKDSHHEDQPPPPETSVGVKPPVSHRIHTKELEQLYIEVLYTITNKVGASSGQFSHYQEDLYSYAQKAFSISHDQHRRYLAIASEEKPPIVVLNVVVLEAEGLEAKDANGFSDPYCMLGIQPGTMASPQPSSPGSPSPGRSASSRALSEGGLDPPEQGHHEKLRKHHSFRLSFKRKERREHRDSISSAVPAKFIRATTVRTQTLNPRWNEKFRFDIDDVTTDILHLDIWDHDDESSVLDAVSKLNEVRGVKGLGRFFKQIAQSARSGSQDDFLGCVNIPVQDIPSTGLDCWYKLEARTQRSNIQGRIRLKMWLSTREDRGTSEEDTWSDIQQQERLHAIFIDYEMARCSGSWNGELPHIALSILHQHAIQADLTELQLAAVEWLAFSRVQTSLDPKVLYRQLHNLENYWGLEVLSKEEEEWLAESFNIFLDYSLQLIRKHRILFPPHHRPSMARLDNLLRCLGLLASMKAFWKVCPFNKEIRGEIATALKKGTLEWYEEQHKVVASTRADPDARIAGLVKLITALIVDLQRGLDYYNATFENTNGVAYFSSIYKTLEKMLAKDFKKILDILEAVTEVGPEVMQLCQQLKTSEIGSEPPTLPPGAEVGTPIFELYLCIQEFANLREHVPDHKMLQVSQFYAWFEPAIDKWMDLAKFKALNRIRKAMELNRFCIGDLIVKHSTSAVDTSACFYQIKEFWRQLAWPDVVGSYNLLMKLVDIICSGSLHYSQLVQQKLQETGYYEDTGAYKTTDEMCVAMNDLEYVRRSVSLLPDELQLEAVLEVIEAAGDRSGQWRDAMMATLETTTQQLQADVMAIIGRIGVKMRGALKKAMFHLAWSPDSLPASEAISPMLEYLDSHLISLNAALLPRNFERVLSVIWDTGLQELAIQMDGHAQDKLPGFYDRLYEALDILTDFFHAEGKGLPMDAIKSETYRGVEMRLQYHKTDTETLITLYYMERLHEQLTVESTEFGTLTVRAYFHHDSLCVEVLNARDVIPLDPNGFSDPFVIVELLPRTVFAHCAEQTTNVQKKTLNPLFDECFEFSVTLSQCRSEGAMIAFTVMDHDVLTANDFAGEAFLSLGSIPGVNSACNADNFHGLKQVELFLMHQKNKFHPILQTLESRNWDKQAQDFVKKQKLRISSS